MKLSSAFVFVLFAARAAAQDELCSSGDCASGSGRSLLQVKKGQGESSKTCSYELHGDQDGSKKCDHLEALGSYTSGSVATLDEEGYQQTAALCCHHEMSLFVRREIARQGYDVCDLSDLHGFVHWYDCSKDSVRTDERERGDDKKTYAEMQKEIAGVPTSPCPWLGHLPNCPVKGENCREFHACHPEAYPADSQPGSSATLDDMGYQAVAKRCCHTEMEQFVRRQIEAMGFQVCEEASLQGFLHWFDCTSDHLIHDPLKSFEDLTRYNDAQTFEKLKEGLVMARSGLPPLCPWLGAKGDACPPRGHNCPVVEVPEPEAHRRRTACR